jgi:hypothetical protein
MNDKPNLLDNLAYPKTQSVEAVTTLAKFLNIRTDKLDHIDLANDARLVLSSKGDCYYYTEINRCTCPGHVFNHTCKHRKALADSRGKERAARPVKIEVPGMTPSDGLTDSIAIPRFRPIPDEVLNDPILKGYDGPAVA